MSNEQNPYAVQSKDKSLSELLKEPRYADRFKQVLGERQPQFVSSLISIGASMKDVEPRSIIGAAMVAAALDLPIDKNLGFAWIIPYKGVAQFQMGARGYIQLAQRSGQYGRMNSTPINHEVFLGYDEVGEPRLDWDKFDPTLPIWGYFFGFQLVNGFVKKAVWTVDKVRKHASRYSKAYQQKKDIWINQFDGMAEKTVVANTLRKWGPMTVQIQRAASADQAVFTDIDAEPSYLDGEDDQQAFDKPSEHPSKQIQEPKTEPKTETAAKQTVKTEAKTAPAVTETPKPSNVVQMPEAKTVETKTEEKELADAGLAPVLKTPTTEPQVVKEELFPADDSAPAPELEPDKPDNTSIGEKQLRLKEEVEGRGYMFAEFSGWMNARRLFNTNNNPADFAGMTDAQAGKLIESIKGVAAGIKEWKAKLPAK